jgi:hypothetical protein
MIASYDRFLTGKSSKVIDYKNIDFLRTFITVQGKVWIFEFFVIKMLFSFIFSFRIV